MREILPNRLWIGNASDATVEGILSAGIEAVVDLAFELPVPDELPRGSVYCRFPVVDGAQESRTVLWLAVQTLAVLLKDRVPTLVFCGAGMSRSPAVVAAALSVAEGGSPNDRLREVVTGHPHDVSTQLWAALQDVCAEIGRAR